MGKEQALETLQQMLKSYRTTQGVTDRNVLDRLIQENCDITAIACKEICDSQLVDSPFFFAVCTTRREALNLSRRCRRPGHAQDKTIPPRYDDFKESVIHLLETTRLADAAGRIPELL